MSIRNMTPDEFDKYDKRCNIIKELILKEYVNCKFDFIRNSTTLYIEVIINNGSKITLLPNSSYSEIKRHIDKKISGFTGDCVICANKIKKNVTCSKCSNNWCGKCYINLFRHGSGIITCPHCRYSFGEEIPEYMLDMYINQIKQKVGR